MSEDGTEDRPDNLVDLQKRKIALQLEKELGGLFGIDYHDVERALERIQVRGLQDPLKSDSREPGQERILRAVQYLESIHELTELSLKEEDRYSAEKILQAVEHFHSRLEERLRTPPEE